MNDARSRISLWKLFSSMLYISAFTFGGGFVIITLMKRRFVDELHWMNDQEMLDMTALAQAAPGAVAINGAILVGRHLRGAKGMLVSVLGTALPPLVILSIISFFYNTFAKNVYVTTVFKGMQAAVVAVIVDVVCRLGKRFFESRDIYALSMLVLAFSASFIWNVNAVFIILATITIGTLKALLFAWRQKG